MWPTTCIFMRKNWFSGLVSYYPIRDTTVSEVLRMALSGEYKLTDIDAVRAGIDTARHYAADHNVPLTIERICVCLGVGRNWLLDYVQRDTEGITEAQKDIQCVLKKAYEEVAASEMEHGMTRGNNPIMPIFALKANHNYHDKQDIDVNQRVVMFDGEGQIPD